MQATGGTTLSKIIMATNPRRHIITIPITLIRMATTTFRILKGLWAIQDTSALDTGAVAGILEATVVTARAVGNNGFFRI
jgi:hypothetical protein